jgi:V/A-type H+/Na+-transporting ATPase subunit I
MIVAMKKVCIICQGKDATATVSQVRTAGVVHVEHQQIPQGPDIAALQEDIGLASAALETLGRYNKDEAGSVPAQKQPADWKISSRHIVDLEKRLDQLREYSQTLKARISEWERWGDADPQRIESLAHRGVFIRFYEIPAKEIDLLPAGLIVKTISVHNGVGLCAIISRQKQELSYKEALLPKVSLTAMRYKLEQDGELETALTHDLIKHNAHRVIIQEHKALREKELEFQQAVAGMGKQGALAYVSGYAPIDSIHALEKTARDHQWAILVSDPGDEDNVPTLLRQPAWISIIRPLLDFLGITPGYRELDVSITFLIFFSIFFGILIGDAGYGFVYLLLTAFFLQQKLGAKHARATLLLYVLSCSAILWGVLTGTFFGQEWLVLRGINAFVPSLNDTKFVQAFCFLLGAVHLSIAHSWRTIVKLPSLAALADLGWLVIVWAAFFLARTLILSDPFPWFGMPLIYCGVGLVVVFTNPQKNMLKAVGEGLGAIALGLVNSFTDVVSYIRLFAVGMAGVAIANATNIMAASSGNSIAAFVIVMLGHTLNLVLGPMSVLVHGVRLNVLEFSGHAGVTWSGSAYAPLQE